MAFSIAVIRAEQIAYHSPRVQSAILAITLRVINGLIRKRAKGHGKKGHIDPGAVTLIQRFGSSINLNVHFHMLVLEGVYAAGEEEPRWVGVSPTTDDDVKTVLQTLSKRILKYLVRKGYFEKTQQALQEGNDSFADEEPVLATYMAASIQYKIGLGARAGRIFVLRFQRFIGPSLKKNKSEWKGSGVSAIRENALGEDLRAVESGPRRQKKPR